MFGVKISFLGTSVDVALCRSPVRPVCLHWSLALQLVRVILSIAGNDHLRILFSCGGLLGSLVRLQGSYLDSCSSTKGTLVDKKLERSRILFGTVDSLKNFIVRSQQTTGLTEPQDPDRLAHLTLVIRKHSGDGCSASSRRRIRYRLTNNPMCSEHD